MAYLMIVAAGLLVAMQAGANARLDKSLHNPFLSSAVSFGSGLAVLIVPLSVYLALQKTTLPKSQQLSAVPWWGWIGGALGALYVLVGVLTVQKIGTGIFVCLSVTASILASIAIDHFGWLEMHRHTAGPGRLMGAVLMVLGLILISRF
jgi:transporter family-2 protein